MVITMVSWANSSEENAMINRIVNSILNLPAEAICWYNLINHIK